MIKLTRYWAVLRASADDVGQVNWPRRSLVRLRVELRPDPGRE